MAIEPRFVIHRIAEAIADERPVDWTPAEQALGADARELENMRLLDDVVRAFRSINEQPRRADDDTPLFQWGPLEVLGEIGEGHTGQVYRAFDPTLQREVALKLRAHRDPLSDPANAQVLGEARRLARIRHRNVLAVYGAAVHDGRAGIWSELIDGRTLAEIVAGDGTFGADEAVRIGLDVCRALGVVHAGGLVHGDVKAENVMRERGGRIVLMDFGSSGRHDDLAARQLLSGTRRYLSPEVLAGASPDACSDLYALGVLLHFLLAGDFPRDETGSVVALARRRPDLPVAFCQRLDAFVGDDIAARPRDAAAFAEALLSLLPGQAEGRVTRLGRRGIAAIAAGVVAALAIGIAAYASRAPDWRVDARFIDPASAATIVDGTPVRLGDALGVRLHATRPSHVYVLNEDADGELNVLFPLAGLDRTNPLPAGEDIDLPGSAGGRALSWQISSPTASEEFVLIASPTPLAALERRLAATPQAGIGGSASARGVAVLQSAPARAYAIEGARLAELVALAEHDAGDPVRVEVRVLRLPHAR